METWAMFYTLEADYINMCGEMWYGYANFAAGHTYLIATTG